MTIRIAIAAFAASIAMSGPAFADTSAYMSTGADTFGKIDLNSAFTPTSARYFLPRDSDSACPASAPTAEASTAAERVCPGSSRSTRVPAR